MSFYVTIKKPKVSHGQQARIKLAAKIAGRSEAQFISDAVIKASEKVVRKPVDVTWTVADRKRVFEALANPPKANDRLKKAFERRAQLLRAG